MTISSTTADLQNSALIVATEPVVQVETWVRARLLDMLLSDPTLYIPDIATELDQQMALVKAVASGREEPLADALYACVWAVSLARREGIRLSNVFESRVRDLVGLILESTPKAAMDRQDNGGSMPNKRNKK